MLDAAEQLKIYRVIVDKSPNPIIINKNWKCIFANQAACDLLLRPGDKFIKRDIRDFIHPDSIKTKEGASCKKDSSMNYEIKLTKYDGKTIYAKVMQIPLYASNELVHILIIRDITDLKVSDAKSEYFVNISHELKNPLNVILSSLQLIEMYHKNSAIIDKSNRLEKYIDIMKHNCLKLLKNVNGLIDVNKIDAGLCEVTLHNWDIVSIIKDAVMSACELAENKKIQLKFYSDTKEKTMACDADKVETIVSNLLSNAIKFTNKGKVEVNFHNDEEYVLISVSDTGTGIAQNEIGEIFKKYKQVNVDKNKNHYGSGVGLYIVKSLCDILGGSICVESKCGVGSKFTVELPVKVLKNDYNGGHMLRGIC